MRYLSVKFALLVTLVSFSTGAARYAHQVISHGSEMAGCVGCDAGRAAMPRESGPDRHAPLPHSDDSCGLCFVIGSVQPAPTLATIAIVFAQPTPEELLAPTELPVAAARASPLSARGPPLA